MKPKSTLEHTIVALSNCLPAITKKQNELAFAKCFPKYAVQSRSNFFCLECGHTLEFISKDKLKKVKCECCGRVLTVLEEIMVVCNTKDQRTDAEIMTAIENTLKWHWDIPTEKVTVVVEDNWVFLSGELEWNYQKEAAKNAISNLIGIIGITNNITVKNSSIDVIEQNDIEIAIERNGAIKSKDIGVYVYDNVVTLKGHVDSWYQKSEAGRIAWNAPGVKQVQNDLYVDFDE